MEIVKRYTYNVYAMGENGKMYRVVSVAGKWRLCVESPRPGEWLFVDGVEYNTADEALKQIA